MTYLWGKKRWLALWPLCCACGSQADADSGDAIAQHLATSSTHSCAIREEGLYCWGRNASGELGDGSTNDSLSAVRALNAGDDVVEVGTHTSRTCVRRKSGEVACLGANSSGQIGDGTRTSALTATVAQGIRDAHQLAVDDNSTCVVHGVERAVSCWGESSSLEPDSGSLVPTKVAGLTGIKLLRVGAFASYCALDDSGDVLCFRIEEGRWSTPKRVDLPRVKAIAMPHPDYVCGVPDSGGILCQSVVDATRVELPGSAGALGLEAGSGGLVLCANYPEQAWRCWNLPSFTLPMMGVENVAGQFPFQVYSDVPARELAIAGFRVCVLREDDSIACVDSA
ncbi:MAG TPA: hypothetical protein VMF89_05425, partial [Polyangiales bacterium]|nr:hypothetical protein [Polyangiales bacterium]